MGPLETIDLNAPGGLKDYCERYGPLYAKLQEQAVPLRWDATLVDRLNEARRDELPLNMAPVRQEWRDRRLMALLAHKATQEIDPSPWQNLLVRPYTPVAPLIGALAYAAVHPPPHPVRLCRRGFGN